MDVDPQEWAALSRLLDEALDVSTDARERWLDTLPAAHAMHREKLRALLRHDAGAETREFRDIFPNLRLSDGAGALSLMTRGTLVGPYVLEQEIGRGGMGVVWRARRSDGVIKRPVALKLPHTAIYGNELLARFESERDILAKLTHPNIARLYDAGFSSIGQPYLALEYVAGFPLMEYCDRHGLNVSQRLRLFQQVLCAVQYAHGHLVIHRDIKPNNVIVGTDDRAMLLDFGIAKLIAADAVEKSERAQLAALTPDYAAPEQIADQPITTASDIYSLGVLLFELLTGQRPYRLGNPSRESLEQAILNIEPSPPSLCVRDEATAHKRATTPQALARTLRGDLDAIILKALKRDPAERYATADAFLQDVEQYLRGETVSARSASRLHQAGKLIARYKLAVAAGAVAVVALLATAMIAFSEARAAKAERDRALALSSRSEAVADFLDLLVTEAGSAGKPVSLGEMLERSEALANSEFRDRPEHRAAVLGMLGTYYHTSAKDQRAEPLLREALGSLGDSPDDDLRRKLTCEHALALAGLGKLPQASQMLRAVVADPGTSSQRAAECLEHLSYVAQDDGNGPDAVKYGRLALEKLREVPHHSPTVEAVLLGGLAYSEHLNGENAEADKHFASSVALFERSGHGNGPEAISVRNNWAILSDGTGNPRQALSLYDATLKAFSENDTGVTPPLYLVANRGHALEGIGRYQDAVRSYLQCRSLSPHEGTPSFPLYCMIGAASASIQLGDLNAAETYADEGTRMLTGFAPDSPWACAMQGIRARLAMKRGQLSGARTQVDAALGCAKDRYLLATFSLIRAEINLLDNKLADAEADARSALAVARDTQNALPHSCRTGTAWLMLGRVLAKRGEREAAHRAFATAIDNLAPMVDADHPLLLLARQLSADATRAVTTPLQG